MKVIDKRKKSKDEDWKIGDVVCYYNNLSEKPNYGLIVGPTSNNKYYLAFLDSGAALGLSTDGFILSVDTDGASSVNQLIKTLRSNWKYVEKVNAHLVVED
ncbi:hypothetical protein [Lactobacillus taiwanensis]|uniref:Uncharacterized protein n=1 Tax=Lactobacillus taiwanensis TaxID=508451 RepID=A0A256LC43_9LACO|nr:hypothetical protein [Lactobacillus taiwanensis]OYR87365.1 hypothetical protein CBF53_07905 [Lactobacillus taiwanensis]OYR90985.1 hypothetical protein CBF70_07345 [Lactobacillus taiwanensis]OYR91260.1 hypothetical protein CBF59_06815 [Lactobacillus taiwanensis]